MKRYFLGIRFDNLLFLTIIWFIAGTIVPIYAVPAHMFETILRNFGIVFFSWVAGFTVGVNQDETFDQKWEKLFKKK